MSFTNQMKLEILSLPTNISFARSTVASFAAQLEFTISDLEEIKVAVSEGVSNAIVHGYGNEKDKYVRIQATLTLDTLEIVIEDAGKGIEDIHQALQPAFTTSPDRLGLGFVFMKSFMNDLQVDSQPGQGTQVRMSRKVGTATTNNREH